MSQPPSYDIDRLFIWEATDHYFCLENCSEWKYKIFTLYHAIKNNVPYQTIFQWHGIQPQNPVVISTNILICVLYLPTKRWVLFCYWNPEWLFSLFFISLCNKQKTIKKRLTWYRECMKSITIIKRSCHCKKMLKDGISYKTSRSY